MNTTEVIKTDAQWNRSAYLNIIGEKVVFDCSDGEYGPIEFDLHTLEKAIEKHKQKESNHTWLSRIRKYTQTDNGN
jgi:hypothetical protein